MGCNVICEKPLVENVKELKKLEKLEEETGNKTYNILQLRHHSEIKKLKKKLIIRQKKYLMLNSHILQAEALGIFKVGKMTPQKALELLLI